MLKDKIAFLHNISSALPIRNWGGEFLNLLFPSRCIICGREAPESSLCAACHKSIPIFPTLFCAACERRIPPPRISCCTLPETALRALGIASSYQNPVIKKAIWGLKYRGMRGLAEPLADILSRYTSEALLPYLAGANARPVLLSPIPLHPKRERLRGFNQAAVLSEILGKKLNLPAVELLRRTRYQKPQAEIGNLQEREENIAGAFSLAPNVIPLENKIIILVDDVATTGATLEEAAQTLRQAGARKIYGLVVCRG